MGSKTNRSGIYKLIHPLLHGLVFAFSVRLLPITIGISLMWISKLPFYRETSLAPIEILCASFHLRQGINLGKAHA